MKLISVLVSVIFSYCLSFCQVSWEKGHLITLTGDKKDVLIKDKDWIFNPEFIEYRLKTDGETFMATPDNVLEIGIGENVLYVSSSSDLDVSSDKLNALDNSRSMKTAKYKVFQKTIIKGKISLYEYVSGLNTRYYFQVDTQMILLNYKMFLSGNGKVTTNAAYKSQLFSALPCDQVRTMVKDINYTVQDLKKIFIEYHQCISSEYKTFILPKSPTLISVAPGLGIDLIQSIVNRKKENIINPKFNIELEALLPINKYKWAINLESTYHQYVSAEVPFSFQTAKKSYKSLEFGLGLRHYFYLNQNSTFFVQGGGVLDYPIENKLVWTTSDPFIDNFKLVVLSLSTGIKHKRFYLHVKWYSRRNLNGDSLLDFLLAQGGYKFDKYSFYTGYYIPLIGKK